MSRRYQDLHLTVASENPFLWVSRIRQALRRRGAQAAEIQRFSTSALEAGAPAETRRVCDRWATVELSPEDFADIESEA